MAQRSVKRPAVRVRWEVEEYTLHTISDFPPKGKRYAVQMQNGARIRKGLRAPLWNGRPVGGLLSAGGWSEGACDRPELLPFRSQLQANL